MVILLTPLVENLRKTSTIPKNVRSGFTLITALRQWLTRQARPLGSSRKAPAPFQSHQSDQ